MDVYNKIKGIANIIDQSVTDYVINITDTLDYVARDDRRNQIYIEFVGSSQKSYYSTNYINNENSTFTNHSTNFFFLNYRIHIYNNSYAGATDSFSIANQILNNKDLIAYYVSEPINLTSAAKFPASVIQHYMLNIEVNYPYNKSFDISTAINEINIELKDDPLSSEITIPDIISYLTYNEEIITYNGANIVYDRAI